MPRDGKGEEPADNHENEDRRRRRAVLALFVVIVLVAATLYIGHVLRQSAATEDCEMQGRTNCAPIDAGSKD